MELPRDDKDFIIEHRIDGYEPEEIGYLLRQEEDSPLRDETVEDFLATDEAQKEIELRKRIQERRADISRDVLVRELRDTMDTLKKKSERLRGSDDEIDNDTVSNMLKTARMLGEFINELKSKDGEESNNVVNINSLEQNFDLTSSVQYLGVDDKKSIAEQLADDPDVEDFVIRRKE